MHGSVVLRFAFLFSLALMLFACSWFHPHGVQVLIANDSGSGIRNLEVDFPGGSFGISSLPSGTSVARWFNPNSPGDLKVIFEDSTGKHESRLAHAVTKLSGTVTLQFLSEGRVVAGPVQARPIS